MTDRQLIDRIAKHENALRLLVADAKVRMPALIRLLMESGLSMRQIARRAKRSPTYICQCLHHGAFSLDTYARLVDVWVDLPESPLE